jgi:hypothetical protein
MVRLAVRETAAVPNDVVRTLSTLDKRVPADPATVERLTAAAGMNLSDEYLRFMASSDGGEGDLGRTWIEIWPAARVLGELESRPSHCEGAASSCSRVLARIRSTDFDRFRDGEVVEGDWIGLNRDELIAHATFANFVTNLAAAQE